MTVKLLTALAVTRGDETALVDARGSTSFAELAERSTRLLTALLAAGLQPGDTLAVVAGNQSEYYEIMMACAHGGFVYVPVNWHWVADEIAYVLDDADARAVFVDARFIETSADAIRRSRTALPALVVSIGLVDPPVPFTDYEALLATGSIDAPADQWLGGPMFYTSGTTGRPKGVVGALTGGSELPSEIMTFVAAGMKQYVPPGGRSLLCGPIYHSAQWALSFLPLINGSSVVMQQSSDPAETLALIDRHGITNVHLVPTQMKRLLALPEATRRQFVGTSLQVAWHGAAPCPPDVKRRLIDWWGPIVSEYYGATEGGFVSTISAAEWLRKGGSVGRPLDTVDVVVVGDDGPVDAGDSGVIYVRSRMGMDFTYHNDSDKTASAHLEPGLFTMGDVGFVDDEGYLWLSDRRIDMIISGGVNIYPAEIEGVLAAHPSVDDVAVIGVPDDEWGEQVKAIVQPVDGFDVGDRAAAESLVLELIDYCRERLAGYKAPRSVDFIDVIPRTASGKIVKAPLRDPFWVGRDRRI